LDTPSYMPINYVWFCYPHQITIWRSFSFFNRYNGTIMLIYVVIIFCS